MRVEIARTHVSMCPIFRERDRLRVHRMKIGFTTDSIDDTFAQNRARTGIFTYTKQLITALLKLDRKNQYTLIHYRKVGEDLYRKTNELIVPLYEIPFWREIRKAIVLPLLISRERLDIIHEPRAFNPYLFSSHTKKILTIHDLSTFVYPSMHTKSNVLRMNCSVSASLRKADRIIAVSKHSKREVLRLFHIDEERIEVIYEGVDARFKPIKKCEGIKKKYGIVGRFILFLGTLEPRKNVNGLIKSFYKLKKMGIEHKLVVAGPEGWKCRDLKETIKQVGLLKEVILPGYVHDDDLPALYSASDLFVYPSLYEGFGLPPLEAMACGTPVVTSNTSSLPEVVGDAAIMVDPNDLNSLADAMYKLLTDEDLAQDMVKKGLRQARFFSWNEAARKTLKVYEDVMQHE